MTAALEGDEWSAARPGRTLPPGKTRFPFYRRLGGPQGRSGRAENLVPIGIRSWTVQPVVSRYTDWATGPTHSKGLSFIPEFEFLEKIFITIKITGNWRVTPCSLLNGHVVSVVPAFSSSCSADYYIWYNFTLHNTCLNRNFWFTMSWLMVNTNITLFAAIFARKPQEPLTSDMPKRDVIGITP